MILQAGETLAKNRHIFFLAKKNICSYGLAVHNQSEIVFSMSRSSQPMFAVLNGTLSGNRKESLRVLLGETVLQAP
jgi:hypothetical protein